MKNFVLTAGSIAVILASGSTLAQQKAADMSGMAGPAKTSPAIGATHAAVAVVKQADPKAGTVTLAHEPINSLNWPAMTMAFKVKDKRLFDKLTTGERVEVELTQRGNDYVVTQVK